MTNSLPSYGTPTSPSLIGKLRNQEEAAWHRLVDCYAPLIGFWGCAEGLQSADVDDLVQEVLRSVSRGIGNFKFDGHPGSFRRWLRSVTASRIADRRRRLQRNGCRELAVGGSTANLRLQQIPQPPPAPNCDVDTVVFVQLLKRTMKHSRLAASSLRIFVKVRIFERPIAQVAEEEGVKIESARKAITRAIKALQEQLPDGLPGFPLRNKITFVSSPPS